jgi:cytidylate kinase
MITPVVTQNGGAMGLDEAMRRLYVSSATTVLIDGRSGSGKTTLATQLCREWIGSALVRLDDVYPGWDGLQWAADHVTSSLLEPRSVGSAGRWRSWDWARQRAGDWHVVEAGRRLVVEGMGALTPVSRSLADLAIWVEADDADRKRRALRRDGELYRPHWDRWAAQEDDFIARYDPRHSADLIAVPVADGFTLTSADDAT